MALKAPRTKAGVFKYCLDNQIEIEHDKPAHDGDTHHVHAYTPSGKIFGGLGTHNLSLWDSCDAPDWKGIGKELVNEEALVDCPDPACEWCRPTKDDCDRWTEIEL